jgi:hypothetical protein
MFIILIINYLYLYIILRYLCTIDNYNNFDKSSYGLTKFMKNENNYSLCDINVFYFIQKYCKGNCAFVGIWRGGLSIWAKANMNVNNKLYLLDTFEKGFNNDDFKQFYFPTKNEVLKNFQSFYVNTNNVNIIKGDCKYTTKNINDKLNLIYIDVDFYNETMNSLVGLYDLLNVNGVCGIDDYNVNFFDAKKAVDLFFKWHGIKSYNKINEYAIYWIKKKPKLLKNCNINLIYNFFCVYNISSTRWNMTSAHILEMIFNYYNFSEKIINFTQDIQKNIGINKTIFGIKKEINNDNINLEYYFYGWEYKKPGNLDNLFNNSRNVNNFNKIFYKYFNKTISIIKKNCIIYSIDIIDNNVNDLTHLYCYKENEKNILDENSSLINYEYNNKTNELIIESESFTYTTKNTNFEDIIIPALKKLGINNFTQIKFFYKNSKYFAFLNKYIKKKIGIYYHCINIDSFIVFLKIAGFKNDFIEYFNAFKTRLEHLSFEIALDYDINIQSFTRFAFYGSY